MSDPVPAASPAAEPAATPTAAAAPVSVNFVHYADITKFITPSTHLLGHVEGCSDMKRLAFQMRFLLAETPEALLTIMAEAARADCAILGETDLAIVLADTKQVVLFKTMQQILGLVNLAFPQAETKRAMAGVDKAGAAADNAAPAAAESAATAADNAAPAAADSAATAPHDDNLNGVRIEQIDS